MSTRLIIVTGKGGVGKSTISAALGYALAKKGKQVLIVEVGDQDVISRFFGVPAPGYQGREVVPGLWDMQLDPWQALEEYGLMKLKLRPFYNMVFGNRVMQGFLQALPGMSELLVLGKIGFEVQDKKTRPWDFVILDAPATGHGLGLLSIPQAVLNTMSTGPMAEDAKRMQDLLTDSRKSTVVMVTLSEHMPVMETIQHVADLKALLGRVPDVVIANRIMPVRMNSYELNTVQAMHRAARRIGQGYLAEVTRKVVVISRMRKQQEQALQMLESRLYLPVQQVPMIPAQGLKRVQRIAGYMDTRLTSFME